MRRARHADACARTVNFLGSFKALIETDNKRFGAVVVVDVCVVARVINSHVRDVRGNRYAGDDVVRHVACSAVIAVVIAVVIAIVIAVVIDQAGAQPKPASVSSYLPVSARTAPPRTQPAPLKSIPHSSHRKMPHQKAWQGGREMVESASVRHMAGVHLNCTAG
jgi:hypothetical protein